MTYTCYDHTLHRDAQSPIRSRNPGEALHTAVCNVVRGRVQRCPWPCETLPVAVCNTFLAFLTCEAKEQGWFLGLGKKGKRGHYDFNKVCNLASTVGLYSIGQAALIKRLFAMSFCIGSHFLATGKVGAWILFLLLRQNWW